MATVFPDSRVTSCTPGCNRQNHPKKFYLFAEKI
jgi:hypothetical protein